MPWITFTLLLLTGFGWAGELKWTHRTEEGEDASSTHYYFFQVEGKDVKRVRWVWNGGAQNPPEVSDYWIEGNKIRIRHLKGKRASIPKLIQGQGAALELVSEFTALRQKDGSMKLVSPAGKELSKDQQIDLSNLEDLLAHERTPIKVAAKSVVIETKFIEVGGGGEELGFDWIIEERTPKTQPEK